MPSRSATCTSVASAKSIGWSAKRAIRGSTIWHAQFGRANIVVAAVLSGVFSPANCELVQNEKDVSLFWDHGSRT